MCRPDKASGSPSGALSLRSAVADTARLDPVDDAHRPARRRAHRASGRWSAMPWKTAFMSSWRALSWHELTHGRAAGCSWVTGGAARPVTRGPGRSRRNHRGSAAAPCLPSGTSVVADQGWQRERQASGPAANTSRPRPSALAMRHPSETCAPPVDDGLPPRPRLVSAGPSHRHPPLLEADHAMRFGFAVDFLAVLVALAFFAVAFLAVVCFAGSSCTSAKPPGARPEGFRMPGSHPEAGVHRNSTSGHAEGCGGHSIWTNRPTRSTRRPFRRGPPLIVSDRPCNRSHLGREGSINVDESL